MIEEIFRYKKIIYSRLEPYGFKKTGSTYQYSTNILNGDFRLEITIEENMLPESKLIDNTTGDEYVLYKTKVTSKYIGVVRMAVSEVLQNISNHCCAMGVFNSDQAVSLIKYVYDKYGDEPEYLWEKFPNDAVLRRSDNKKWYALLLNVSRRKLGFKSDEIVEILDLRGEPNLLKKLIDNKRYHPGWHMNKKNWYTIILDGSVPLEEIFVKIDESYHLTK